jgi:hypothetical protein
MAKKKKEPTAYELALDIVRAPVRRVDEAIQSWDNLSKLGPAMADFNAGTRIASMLGPMDVNDVIRIAEAVMDAYGSRFAFCAISNTRSAYTGKPLFTEFHFSERAYYRARGIHVEASCSGG